VKKFLPVFPVKVGIKIFLGGYGDFYIGFFLSWAKDYLFAFGRFFGLLTPKFLVLRTPSKWKVLFGRVLFRPFFLKGA